MYPATMMSFQWSDAWFYSWFFLLPLFFFRATFAQMMLAPELNEIVAAGGVVLERTNETVRVVLIHRPKYDDWSLPKGKSEPGESISQTALREVKEETGLDCKIVSELEPVRYSYRTGKGTIVPKVVHYFLMEPMGGRLEAPGQEADAAEWCDVTEALRRLTHQHDRELVQKAVRRK
ncbi:MAG TPA: NUDIX hydrolase [Blastocatellia bacterium]|nr:NUDIX hydrolase [Blastocatellia bacterium]